MTRSLKKVARTFDTVLFLYNLYLCPLVVTELLLIDCVNHLQITVETLEEQVACRCSAKKRDDVHDNNYNKMIHK